VDVGRTPFVGGAPDPLHDRLSAVIVTTPQALALTDAMKSLAFTRAVKSPVLGMESMKRVRVPVLRGEISNVF
jgi:Mrp family chromosome partitioning ATPase